MKGEGEKTERELLLFFFSSFFPICVFFNSSYLNSRARTDTRGSRFQTFTGGKKKRSDVERTRGFAVCDRFCGRSCGRIRFKIHRLVVGFLSVSSVFRGKKKVIAFVESTSSVGPRRTNAFENITITS